MIKLSEFLENIWSTDETRVPVWVYDDAPGFSPNNTKNENLLLLWHSDYEATSLLLPKVCEMTVEKIFWTAKGILLTVKLEEDHADDD